MVSTTSVKKTENAAVTAESAKISRKFMRAVMEGDNTRADETFSELISKKLESRIREVVSKENSRELSK